MKSMKFVLGSKNEAKLQAAEVLLREVYGKDFTLEYVGVDSGVSQTPTNDDEGIRGALQRIANTEKALPNRDGYFGLEGIITTNTYGTFLCGWAVLKLKDGRVGYGCSAKVRLPDELMEGFASFRRLSDIMAVAYPNQAMLLPEQGTNGVLTNGMYTRVDEFTDALRCAFGVVMASPLERR
jgi:non-canonical (house-cleaning) NTP pyrophosphatase